MHDRIAIALVLKELLARTYLSLGEVAIDRRFRSPKGLLVLMPGPRLRPSGNPILDSVLDLVQQAAPPSGKSEREEARELGEAARAAFQASIDASAADGHAVSYRTIRADFDARVAKPFPALPYRSLLEGRVGVSVEDLTTAVLQKHASSGWRWVGHDYVRAGVLPALVERGYLEYKARKLEGCLPHRCSYEYRRRLTHQGQIERKRLEDRLKIRTRVLRMRACTKALDRTLIGVAHNGTGIEQNFRAIEHAVTNAWRRDNAD